MRKIVWTEEMDRALTHLYATKKYSWIRERGAMQVIGVGGNQARARLKELGLMRPPRRATWVEEACRLRRLGLTWPAVARALGRRSDSEIYKRCLKADPSLRVRVLNKGVPES